MLTITNVHVQQVLQVYTKTKSIAPAYAYLMKFRLFLRITHQYTNVQKT